MPCLQDIWSSYSSKGVQVVSVCEGWWGSTEAQADAWLTGKGVTFSSVFDPSPYPIGQSYDVNGVPRIFIIDQDMKIAHDWVGEVDCSVLKGALDNLLPMIVPKFKFALSVGIPDRLIPRWMKVAYLILSVKTERMFKEMDVRTGERFNKVVSKHLNAYLARGTIPPKDIAAPIMNLADDLMAGKVMNLRAGDYIAIQNHIRAMGKGRSRAR